jgi:Co/Zn/Cd efflux system component
MTDTCCATTIDIAVLQARQRRVLMIVLVINLATFVMMLAAAIYSGSSSLLSGGLDNLGDALTYLLSLAVIGASGRAKARVVLFKGALILSAALAAAIQIGWRLLHPGVPIFEAIGIAALLNLLANAACLRLLLPYRKGDVNMASAWECSRNDVFEGIAVLAAGAGVGLFSAGWPDLLVASALLLMFLRSAWRVFGMAWRSYTNRGKR